MIESSVFSRTESSGAEVSAPTYNMLIGLILCWGLLVNWMIVRNVDPMWLRSINIWIFFIGYFAMCFLGVHLFNTSSEPAISFIGYNLVVVPFGLILNLVVSQYDPSLVMEAIAITAMVTILMMILGSIYPQFFDSIFMGLTVALLAVIVIEAAMYLFFGVRSSWIDWAVAAIFCGYVGYDWGRANRIPHTLDNAIDSAASIYMDIINLFMRVLRILGRRR